MVGFGSYKPVLAMVFLQCIVAGFALFSKAALSKGMSPRVFVVYRQAVATLITAPPACFSRWRNPHKSPVGLKSFSLIFVASLIGVTGNQNAFVEGLRLSSSTIAIAMSNLLPAITFVMAAALRLEKVDRKSMRSVAKIIGTVLSIIGGVCMALVKGPKLIDSKLLPSNKSISITSSGADEHNWQLGCLYLFFCFFCWSFWKIMQVPISATCPDLSYSTLWMCIFSTLQSAVFTLLVDRDLQAWRLGSVFEFGSCLYAGFTSAAMFYIETWCISQRGPVFSAVFGPLSTVITAILATLLLHENLYIGSLLGAIAVIGGLYVVLWGKAKDQLQQINQTLDSSDILPQCDDQRQASDPSCSIDLPHE